MKYMGGKFRLAKHILQIIGVQHNSWVEPCLGGNNFAWRVHADSYLLNDADPDLAEFYRAYQRGWSLDYQIDEDKFKELLRSPPCPDRTFAKFAMSYGAIGKSFARSRTQTSRDFQRSGLSLLQIKVKAKHNYTSYDMRSDEFIALIPLNSTVYIDPPYDKTHGYKCKLPHDDLLVACEKIKRKDCKIYISEFKENIAGCVQLWTKDRKTSIGQLSEHNKTVTERLYDFVG